MVRQSWGVNASGHAAARPCATSPAMRDHRRVHDMASFEALPQYRMWYLTVPPSRQVFANGPPSRGAHAARGPLLGRPPY